jgi:hypothetical protein
VRQDIREMAVSDEMTSDKGEGEEDMLRRPQMNWEKGRNKRRGATYTFSPKG